MSDDMFMYTFAPEVRTACEGDPAVKTKSCPSLEDRLAKIARASESGYVGSVKHFVKRDGDSWTEYKSERYVIPPGLKCSTPGDVFVASDGSIHLRMYKRWEKWTGEPMNARMGQRHPRLHDYVYKVGRSEKDTGWRTAGAFRKVRSRKATSSAVSAGHECCEEDGKFTLSAATFPGESAKIVERSSDLLEDFSTWAETFASRSVSQVPVGEGDPGDNIAILPRSRAQTPCRDTAASPTSNTSFRADDGDSGAILSGSRTPESCQDTTASPDTSFCVDEGDGEDHLAILQGSGTQTPCRRTFACPIGAETNISSGFEQIQLLQDSAHVLASFERDRTRLLTDLRETWASNVCRCPTVDAGLRIFDALVKVADDITLFDSKRDSVSSMLPPHTEERVVNKDLVYRDMLYAASAHRNVYFLDNMGVCPDTEFDVPAFLASLHDSLMNTKPLSGVRERLISAIDVPASLSGLGSLQLALPEFLGNKVVGAPSQDKHLAKLGRLAWRSCIVPRGGITHVRMDFCSQLVTEVERQSKLWLLWPPLKVNFDFMCGKMARSVCMESTAEAIESLEGLQLLPRFGRPIVFYLPACYIHAVLTIDTSIHIGLPCFDYGGFEITLDFMRMYASHTDGQAEGLNAIRKEIDMWRVLASPNCEALDNTDRLHFQRKIDEVSAAINSRLASFECTEILAEECGQLRM